MTGYKISKIYIKNFKHIDRLSLDFTKKDLIVLDGPNGFGKTTLFDAIELTLAGQISRVKNTIDNRYGYSQILFAKENGIDTEIKMEFIKGEKRLIFAKRIDSSIEYKASDKKPDNWGLFESYRLPDFESSIDQGELIESEEISKLLGVDNLKRYFSLFYYVQQEENTFFLKQNAKDRLSEISQLFDTYNEEKELEKLKKTNREVQVEIKKIDGPEGFINERESRLQLFTQGIQDIDIEELEDIEYFSLLPKVSIIPEWDKKDLKVQKGSRDIYLDELRDIYRLVDNLDSFIKMNFNEELTNFKNQKEIITSTIRGYNFLSQFEELNSLVIKEKKIRGIRRNLMKEELQKRWSVQAFKEIKDILNIELEIESITIILEQLKTARNKMGELSELVQNLNETREELLKRYSAIQEIEQKSDCPFCGASHESYENLITAINVKSEKFANMYDESTKEFTKLYEEFYSKEVVPILIKIDEYLLQKRNIVDAGGFDYVQKAKEMENEIHNFVEWCTKKSINIQPFLKTDLSDLDNIEVDILVFVDHLSSYEEKIVQPYTNHLKHKSTLKKFFENDIELAREVSKDLILKKVEYINYQYYHLSSRQIQIIKKELEQYRARLKKIKQIKEKIDLLIEVYEESISQHWKKIIRDIEIPFYIYSGKIIQNYQQGCGIFLYENEDNGQKTIRFVSDLKSDHDAVNYLSSGQLSGLVISFTLALNKVYGENSIDILMIDDPVQTMDELNLVSLIELLRNEFSNKQIFLSTHEEEVSRYMRYKFSKYNLNTMRVNVKNEIYPNMLNKG